MTAKKLQDEYVRSAKLLEITDGDTVVLSTDLGCDIYIHMKCRLDGINSPEKITKEGKDAKAFIEKMLPIGCDITIKTVKDKKEKFGRYLAIIFLKDDPVSVNQKMIDAGHAVEYHGEKRT